MKKILVTGALGHIGSRFIRTIKPGQFSEVILVDNLSTQRYPSLFNLPSNVPFRFLAEDICTADLNALFKGIDVVLHMAAATDAAGSANRADEVRKVNFTGTERVAKACAETGAKLIFFSTTSVYGTAKDVVDENCTEEELKPQSPYAHSKIEAERLLAKMGAEEGLRFIVCRFGTIFGASIGMRFHTAVNKFIWQACLNLPITVWRTALHQKRPYLDLEDAVRALHFIIEGDHFDNRVYNVLTTNCTVNDIVEAIRKYQPDLKINFVDEAIMNQLSYEVACERFKSLGFVFQGNLDRSVSESVALLRNLQPQILASK